MKKGISLASLGIVLIVLSIITAIVIIDSDEYITETRKAKFVTDFMLVETAVNKYYDNNQVYPIAKQNNVDSTIVLLAANNADQIQFGDKYNEAIIGLELKIIDVSLLGYDELTTGLGANDTDYYGISDDGMLYYVKGFEYNGKTYYMVVDDLK